MSRRESSVRESGSLRRSSHPVVVIGAGPAGLTAAYELTSLGFKTSVFEKHNRVGGLARTEQYKGNYFDLGGHRFYTQVAEIERLWRHILGDDLLRRPRLSRIYYRRRFFSYPLKPLDTLYGLGAMESVLIVLSYLRWRAFPHRLEDTYQQWVTNRFGKRLFETFFKAYTEKVWGIPCDRLRAEWAAQRIKDLSFASVLRHMFRKPRNQVRSLIEEFLYPRRGPGMMWQATRAAIERQGGEVHTEADVLAIRRGEKQGWSVLVSAGTRPEWVEASAIISTMPLTEFVERLRPPPPENVLQAARQLTYRDFLTVCLIVDAPRLFPDNWIYVHDPAVAVARIQNFKNWSPVMVADPATSTLGLEYFCTADDELWSMSDAELIRLAGRELDQIGLAKSNCVRDGCVFRVPKAYPIYDADYRDYLAVLRQYVEQLDCFQPAGRNGLHRYNNQDHAMLTGMLAARNLVYGEQNDVWRVNGEESYLEHVRLADYANQGVVRHA